MNTGAKIFVAVIRQFQRLPLGFHYAVGRFVSWFAASVLRYRRDVVMVNIARSFPDLKWKEIRRIARDFYKHFGDLLAEAIWFGGSYKDPSRLRRQGICTIKNPEVINGLFEKGSVMVLTSHLGNWELIGGALQYFPEGYQNFSADNVVVVYKKLKNEFWNYFMGVNRSAPIKDYKGYVESRNVLRFALEHRDMNMIYVFPTDQFPYKEATRHEIPSFMNQKTQVMTGGAALAHKFHMAVVYSGMNRISRGHYEKEFVTICEDAATMTPEEIMIEYYRLLEEGIKADPANYLWSHNRWK